MIMFYSLSRSRRRLYVTGILFLLGVLFSRCRTSHELSIDSDESDSHFSGITILESVPRQEASRSDIGIGVPGEVLLPDTAVGSSIAMDSSQHLSSLATVDVPTVMASVVVSDMAPHQAATRIQSVARMYLSNLNQPVLATHVSPNLRVEEDEDTSARDLYSSRLSMLRSSLLGVSALALGGYMHMERLLHRSRSASSMRIQQLEQELSRIRASEAMQTAVDFYAGSSSSHESPIDYGITDYVPTHHTYSTLPLWSSVGLGACLLGGYVAHRLHQSYRSVISQREAEKSEAKEKADKVIEAEKRLSMEVSLREQAERSCAESQRQIDIMRMSHQSSVSLLREQLELLRTEIAYMKRLSIAFDASAWRKYFGVDVGQVPVLPDNIDEILNSMSPFLLEGESALQRVGDNHLLTLIPSTVDGEAFTLDKLGALVLQNHDGYFTALQGNNREELGEYSHGYRCYNKFLTDATRQTPLADASYWALLPKTVLHGGRRKPFSQQKEMVAQYCNDHYELPHALVVVTSLLAHYARSGGERWYATERHANGWRTYTRCLDVDRDGDLIIAGGFEVSGIGLDADDYDNDSLGITCFRKL